MLIFIRLYRNKHVNIKSVALAGLFFFAFPIFSYAQINIDLKSKNSRTFSLEEEASPAINPINNSKTLVQIEKTIIEKKALNKTKIIETYPLLKSKKITTKSVSVENASVKIINLALQEDCTTFYKNALASKSCVQPSQRRSACKAMNHVSSLRTQQEAACANDEEFNLAKIDTLTLSSIAPSKHEEVSCDQAWSYYQLIAPEFELRQENIIKARRAKLAAEHACGVRIASENHLASEEAVTYFTERNIVAYKIAERNRRQRITIPAGVLVSVRSLEKSEWLQVEVDPLFTKRAKINLAFVEKEKGLQRLSDLSSLQSKPNRQLRYASTLIAQQFLNSKGCDVGAVDGAAGAKTKLAFERIWLNNRNDLPFSDYSTEILPMLINFSRGCQDELEADYAIGLIQACDNYRQTKSIFRNKMALARAPGGGCGFAEGYQSVNLAKNAALKQCAEINRVNLNQCRIVFSQ